MLVAVMIRVLDFLCSCTILRRVTVAVYDAVASVSSMLTMLALIKIVTVVCGVTFVGGHNIAYVMIMMMTRTSAMLVSVAILIGEIRTLTDLAGQTASRQPCLIVEDERGFHLPMLP